MNTATHSTPGTAPDSSARARQEHAYLSQELLVRNYAVARGRHQLHTGLAVLLLVAAAGVGVLSTVLITRGSGGALTVVLLALGPGTGLVAVVFLLRALLRGAPPVHALPMPGADVYLAARAEAAGADQRRYRSALEACQHANRERGLDLIVAAVALGVTFTFGVLLPLVGQSSVFSGSQCCDFEDRPVSRARDGWR